MDAKAATAATQRCASSIIMELRDHKFWKAVRCEFLCAFFYVFFGCGSFAHLVAPTLNMTPSNNTASAEDSFPSDLTAGESILIASTFGLSSASLIQCFGHISGAHMNPAITLSMLATRNITPVRALIYAIVQLLGSITGIAVLYGITPEPYLQTSNALGSVMPHQGLSSAQAFGVEFMITFMVTLTIFANAESCRLDMGSRSLSIGFAVMTVHLFALKYTGAGLNPARCLAPAIFTANWKGQWVYWIGPTLGAIIGGFTYEYTRDASSSQSLRFSFSRPQKNPPQMSLEASQSMTSLGTEMTYASRSTEDVRI